MGNKIKDFLKKKKFHTASDDTYGYVEEWKDWYEGEVKGFHDYTIFNGVVSTKQKRYKLAMAKKICEDWANLLINEKVAIKAEGEFGKRLEEILHRNNFLVRANQLIELTFALGTGAFVEYKDENENVLIDYVRGDMIYPLSWDNGEITECALVRIEQKMGKNIYTSKYIVWATKKKGRM